MPLQFQNFGYLQPPSQLQEAEIKQQEDAVREKAGLMLRKSIGFARMRDEAAQLENSGVEPLTARKTALLNNAHLLFSDNPAAVERLLASEELAQTRQAANAQLSFFKQQSEDRLRARDEEIAKRDETTAELRKQGLLDRADADAQRNANSVLRAQNELQVAQLRAQTADADRLSRERQKEQDRAIQQQKLNRPSAAELKAKSELDNELSHAKRLLAQHIASGQPFFGRASWQKTKAYLESQVQDLTEQRAAMDKQAGGEEGGDEETAAPQPPAAPEPGRKVFLWKNGKIVPK